MYWVLFTAVEWLAAYRQGRLSTPCKGTAGSHRTSGAHTVPAAFCLVQVEVRAVPRQAGGV